MRLRKSALIVAGLSALVIFGVLVNKPATRLPLQETKSKSDLFQATSNKSQMPSVIVRDRESIDKTLKVQEKKAVSLELQVKEQIRLLEANMNQSSQLNIALNLVQSMRNDLPPNATNDTVVKPNQELTNALIAAGLPVQEPKNKAELDALNQLITSNIQTSSSSMQNVNLKMQTAMKQWNDAVKFVNELMKTRKSINESLTP
ncbi:hypothetical protein [Paenibacillus herberti]|uniref:Uncharacterized protein n=1 Tax=Paenibacillus herberti TaxID=1619309 RepID=A0A229NU94_9BACL|nr:hypothetical protein [Paenibacillus herberti]OXM13418.1 hypothetical protein CGZ75_20405 [Paenibacillus herberti]